MTKKLFALFGLSVAMAVSGSAAAEEGVYLQIMGGASFLEDADNEGDVVIESDFDAGSGVVGALGYQFGGRLERVRLEGEVGWRRNEVDSLTVTDDGGIGVAAGLGSLDGLTATRLDGDVEALSFMINGFYEIDVGRRFLPYIGGGIGAARIQADDIAVRGVTIVDDEDWVFAFQVGGGVEYSFSPAVALFVDYRYFATSDPDLEDITGGDFESEYSSHMISGGVRFRFTP